MKTKMLSIMMLMMMLLTVFSGCRESKPSESEASGTLQTEICTEETPPDTHEAQPTVERPTEPEVTEPSLSEKFSQVKVEVLAKAVVPYEDSAINGYGAYSEDYETATILTLGLTFPDRYSAFEFGVISVIGETAEDEDGKPVPQTTFGAGWENSTLEKPYVLVVHRVAGEIDTAKVRLRLKESWGGSASAEVTLVNGGEPAGFSSAEAAFPDQIKVLQGRTYKIVRRYWSSYSAGGDSMTDTVSYVLVPLEGGLGKSLDPDGMRLCTPNDIRGTVGELLVNVNSAIDASTVNEQSTVELAITRQMYESRGEDGHYSDDVLDQVTADINAFARASYVEIEDGSGGTVTLPFGG